MSDLTTEELELGIAIAKRSETPLHLRSPELCDEMSWEAWCNTYGIKAIRELLSRRLRIAELEEAVYLADTEHALSQCAANQTTSAVWNIVHLLGPLFERYAEETLEAVGGSLQSANRMVELVHCVISCAEEHLSDKRKRNGE